MEDTQGLAEVTTISRVYFQGEKQNKNEKNQ